MAAYSELIEALAAIERYHNAVHDAALGDRDLTAEKEKALVKPYNDGYLVVRRAALTGAFLFSSEVSAALAVYLDDALETTDWYTRVSHDLAIVSQCRKVVVSLAAADLSLTNAGLGLIGSVKRWLVSKTPRIVR